MLQVPGVAALGIGEHGDCRCVAVPVPSIQKQHRYRLAFDLLPQDRRNLSVHELYVVLLFDCGRGTQQ